MPPLDARDIEAILRADGWFEVPGTRHRAFEHAEKPGKVNFSAGVRDVRKGTLLWRSIFHQQAGLTDREVERIYWEQVRG